MDWSSVYDDHGEEEGDWDSLDNDRTTRLAYQIEALQRKYSFARGTETTLYTPLVAYAFTVNYILGVGSLGIPYAFYRAGAFIGVTMIVGVSILSMLTVNFVVETVSRAKILSRLPQFLESPVFYTTSVERQRLNPNPRQAINPDEKSWEVTELCQRFLGPTGKWIYKICLIGLMCLGLLGYAQVFCNSLQSQIVSLSGYSPPTYYSQVFFAIVVVPLSCIDLTEQVSVQVAMAAVRFVSLAIMIIGALTAIFTDPYDGGWNGKSQFYVSDLSASNLGGLGLMFSTALFSQLFQHSVPGLIHPLSSDNKKHIRKIFGRALTTTACLYVILGLLCALYFGPALYSSVNLNWSNFTWGLMTKDQARAGFLPFWARLLSFIVVIFPALDVISVYPLIAITLGNNLAASMHTHGMLSKQANVLFWRIIASTPMIVISMFVGDLAVTMQFAGIFGIWVAFVAPALLQRASSKIMKQATGTASTSFSWSLSGMPYVAAVLFFALVAEVVVVYQIVESI